MDTVNRFWRTAIEDRMPLLVSAAIVVGVAISMDGDSRRTVNGIGGLLWLAAALLIFMRSVAAGVGLRHVLIVAIVIIMLSYLIRPTDPLWAVIGFGWGGVAVGYYGQELGSRLGAMLGALWLPAHLLVAIGRVIVRNLRDEPATLRGDPPPTAMLVPLIMVLAAWVFATLAADWRASRQDGRLLVPRSPVRSRR